MLSILKRAYSWYYDHYINFRARKSKGWQLYSSKRLGLTLLLNCNNFIDFLIWENGCFEKEVLNGIDTYCKHNRMLFIDVGSQLGQFSLYVKNKFPGANVLSFEPNKDAYDQQRANMLINKINYPLIPKALSLQQGEASFYIPSDDYEDGYGKQNPGTSSLLENFKSTSTPLIVDTDTLDNYRNVWEQHDQILLKVDVEGAEWMVLAGGKELFTSDKKLSLIVELYSESHPENVEKVRNYLKEWGFLACDQEWQIIDDLPTYCSGNYFFTRMNSM